MRTSRNAWGRSLAEDASAAMEWELGSRVMNDLEAENTPYVRHGALAARLQRAMRTSKLSESDEANQYMNCLITVKGENPNELLYVYDISADNDLMCSMVAPEDAISIYSLRLVSPADVEDFTAWEQVKTGGSEDAHK